MGLVWVGFILLVTGVYNEQSRTYSGSEEFQTISEAQEYQAMVLNAALSYNAEVRQCDITYTSPPQLSFTVVLPAEGNPPFNLPKETSFPIGEGSGIMGVWIALASLWVFVTILFVGLPILAVIGELKEKAKGHRV
jgi:hypothetical protein